MSDPHEDLVRRLAAGQAWIAHMLEHQLEINNGHMHPILFTGFVTSEAVRRADTSPTEFQALAAALETEFGRDPDVDELIGHEFLDGLPDPGHPGAQTRALLGPRLRSELARREEDALRRLRAQDDQ